MYARIELHHVYMHCHNLVTVTSVFTGEISHTLERYFKQDWQISLLEIYDTTGRRANFSVWNRKFDSAVTGWVVRTHTLKKSWPLGPLFF